MDALARVGREGIARAAELVLARNDLEPTSEATLRLYREDAYAIADSLLPAPKLGEGEDHDDEIEDAFKEGVAIGYLCGREEDDPEAPYTLHDDAINEAFSESKAIKRIMARFDGKPQQPAPGAPEDVERETFRLKTNPESDPVLKAIIDVRGRAAGDFTPAHSGQRGEDFDRGLLAAFHAAQDALVAALTSSSAKPGGEEQ